MTDSDTTPQPDSQPDAQAGDPVPASGDDDETPDGEASAEDDADDQDGGNISREARKYRRRLRAAEAERDAVQQVLDRTRQSIVDDTVAAAGFKPRLLSRSDHQLADFVTDDGTVDREKVTAAVQEVAAEIGATRKPTPPLPNAQQGNPGPPPTGQASGAKALKPS